MISSASSPNWPIAASKLYPVAFQKSCSDYSDKLYREESKEAEESLGTLSSGFFQ